MPSLRAGPFGTPSQLDDAAQVHPAASGWRELWNIWTESRPWFPYGSHSSSQTVARQGQARAETSTTGRTTRLEPSTGLNSSYQLFQGFSIQGIFLKWTDVENTRIFLPRFLSLVITYELWFLINILRVFVLFLFVFFCCCCCCCWTVGSIVGLHHKRIR